MMVFTLLLAKWVEDLLSATTFALAELSSNSIRILRTKMTWQTSFPYLQYILEILLNQEWESEFQAEREPTLPYIPKNYLRLCLKVLFIQNQTKAKSKSNMYKNER